MGFSPRRPVVYAGIDLQSARVHCAVDALIDDDVNRTIASHYTVTLEAMRRHKHSHTSCAVCSAIRRARRPIVSLQSLRTGGKRPEAPSQQRGGDDYVDFHGRSDATRHSSRLW